MSNRRHELGSVEASAIDRDLHGSDLSVLDTPPADVSFIARVAGLPVRVMHELLDAATIGALDDLSELDSAIANARDVLSAELHTLIGKQTEIRDRRKLIELRRKLYNMQLPQAALWTAVNPLLGVLQQSISSFVELLEQRGRIETLICASHEATLGAMRAHLQCIVGDQDFQKGLLLSSQSLFKNRSRYVAADPNNLSSREEYIERGLLRYVTRMAAKTAPFGRFCAVIPGEFTPCASEASPAFTSDPRAKRGVVRLNKALYGALWAALTSRHEVRRRIDIELNPTLKMEVQHFAFLMSNGTRETFQRLARNEALDLVVAVIRRGGATLGDLVEQLTADAEIETTEQESIAYLNRLLDMGLLRFKSGVPTQIPDWDTALKVILQGVDDDYARIVVDLLDTLRALVTKYETASADARASITDRMRSTIATALEAIGLPPRATPQPLIYEDATSEAVLSIPYENGVAEAVAALGEFIQATQAVGRGRIDQATMRAFFDRHYAADEGQVPLLRFYEDYYREHMKDHLVRQAQFRHAAQAGAEVVHYDAIINPFGLESINSMRRACARFTELVRSKWAAAPNAKEITLARADVRSALGTGAPNGERRSASVFCEVITNSRQPARLLLDHTAYFAGYGKYFSRFLYLFPDEFQERVFTENAEFTDVYLAEIRSESHFNAEMHPPLTPWEISYPTGDGNFSRAQVLATDIAVTTDAAEPSALRLVHCPAGQRVLPVDLGFLNPLLRPPLFQLLAQFAPTNSCAIELPNTPVTMVRGEPADTAGAVTDVNSEAHAPAVAADRLTSPVTYRPRVTYVGKVVIARRRWTVSRAHVPVSRPQESAALYFVRVDRWRRLHGIPRQVYVRVFVTRSPDDHLKQRAASSNETTDDVIAEGPQEPQDTPAAEDVDYNGVRQRSPLPASERVTPRAAHNLNKPQYIDFASPLLVKLFAKLCESAPQFYLSIEERYPEETALTRYGDERYVTELVLQLPYQEARSVTGEITSAPSAVRAVPMV